MEFIFYTRSVLTMGHLNHPSRQRRDNGGLYSSGRLFIICNHRWATTIDAHSCNALDQSANTFNAGY